MPPPPPLPTLSTSLPPPAITSRLDALARRGKLPGFSLPANSADPSAPLFTISDFGAPFEARLTARLTRATDFGSAKSVLRLSTLRFDLSLRPLFPTIFALVLLITIWPGLPLTHSLLVTYFPSYRIETWWWYLPLTVPAAPWAMWSAVKKSRAAAHAGALALIEKIAAELAPPSPQPFPPPTSLSPPPPT